MSLPIPAKGPKVTSLIWNGLDDLLVTGHDNGDIVQVFITTLYIIFYVSKYQANGMFKFYLVYCSYTSSSYFSGMLRRIKR